MPAQLHRSMTAVPACVPALRGAIADYARREGVGEPLLSSVKLAVSEGVTNAVLHAYAGGEPGPVRVDAWIEDGRLLVEVSDDGDGMMPRVDSPGLGVGLPFIADTADALDISSSPRGGALLRMTFALQPAAQPSADPSGLSAARPAR